MGEEKLVKVRIRAEQRVRYDQTIEMPEKTWAEIRKAMKSGVHGRQVLARALDWLDLQDVLDADEMDPDDAEFELVKP